jgi:hypothetical protein
LPDGTSDCEALMICSTPDEFAAAMMAWAEMPDARKSAAAAALYEKHFSSERYRQKMISVIDAGLSCERTARVTH